jgi:TetR/AcrR family transcriptional regulator, regulator of cefoperazone and chloramphenicol sensitivity
MKVPREDAVRTQKRLLAAASEAFAEKGYREATVSEICERAKSNVAAVNYHFGDKETLYIKAWRHAFYESLKVHPPDGGVSADAPPEDRLQGRVKALLRRVTGLNNRASLIVLRELASPTGLLDEVTRKDLRPLRDKMEGLIRELLGPHASETQVRFCTTGIVSQCLIPMFMKRMDREKQEGGSDYSNIDGIESYADHIVKFSLAGIRSIRKEAERRTNRNYRGIHENQ